MSTSLEELRGFRVDPVLAGIVAAAVGVRVALALHAAGTPPINDEIAYLGLADGLLRGDGYGTLFRPPLYPAFLAACGALFDSLEAVRVVQALLGGLSIPLAYVLARRVGGVPCARLAAGLFALDPVLAGFSAFFWSETLYVALFLGGLVVLVGAGQPPRPLRWLAAGALFGLAGLTRPVLLSFLPLLLPWAAVEWRLAPGREERADPRPFVIAFALLTVGACLVVLPWTVRNYRTTGAFVLVDTNGPYNLLVSTHPGAHGVAKDDRWSLRWGAIEGRPYRELADLEPARAQQLALATARARIAAEPLRYTGKSLFEAAHLFTLDNFVLRHLRNGWYRGVPGWLPGLAALVCALFSAALIGGGLVGWIAAPPSGLRRLVALALLHATLVFGLTYSLSRYGAPLRPLLGIGAAWLVTHAPLAKERLGQRRRLVLAVGAAALLALAWAQDVPLLADMLMNGGAGFTFVREP